MIQGWLTKSDFILFTFFIYPSFSDIGVDLFTKLSKVHFNQALNKNTNCCIYTLFLHLKNGGREHTLLSLLFYGAGGLRVVSRRRWFGGIFTLFFLEHHKCLRDFMLWNCGLFMHHDLMASSQDFPPVHLAYCTSHAAAAYLERLNINKVLGWCKEWMSKMIESITIWDKSLD